MSLNGLSNIPPLFDNMESYVYSYINDDFLESVMWEYTDKGICLYKIDRASSEVVYDQTNCMHQSRENKQSSQRMLSDVNLNTVSGELKICNIFTVYKLLNYNPHYWTVNRLFGHNGSFNKVVSFLITKDLLISYRENYLRTGPTASGRAKNVVSYKNKANAGEFNKRICLSVHYDVDGGNDASSVYCNGQKLYLINKQTFGDLSPNGIPELDGYQQKRYFASP